MRESVEMGQRIVYELVFTDIKDTRFSFVAAKGVVPERFLLIFQAFLCVFIARV